MKIYLAGLMLHELVASSLMILMTAVAFADAAKSDCASEQMNEDSQALKFI